MTQPDGKSSGLRPDAILGHAEQLARLPGDVLVPRCAVPHGPDSARWELCRATGHDVAIAACRTALAGDRSPQAVYGEPRWASFATLAILRGTR